VSEEPPRSIFDVVGEDGVARLVEGFYRRVPSDEVLGPMYPEHDLAGAERRLCDFLVYRLGGPARYVEERGHPRLRMRHAPFAIDRAARDRWMAHMDASLAECDLDPRVREALHAFLGDVATFLVNRAG